MKKTVWITAVFLLGFVTLNAQKTNFGVVAGYHNFSPSFSLNGFTTSIGTSGYFVGMFVDFPIAEKFRVQPEIHFAQTFLNGESGNELIIPIMGKYLPNE
ncbi:MAG: hypothetical protein ACWIPI_02840 [Polaribacter sp.]